MPMTFTDEMIPGYATRMGCEPTREAVAGVMIERYEDYVAAWEVLTGRPWTDMTRKEALELVKKYPEARRIPAVFSRLKA